MPRGYFEYTREKLVSFNRQIKELLVADFPIPRTRNALAKLSAVFEAQLKRLDTLGTVSDDVRKQTCAHTNVMIKKFLPLLGFVLRSTNVRNSFELADPITRLASHLFSRDLIFVLSSEWEFSPLTYSLSFEELHDVIFLGLPSFESSNALIVPLGGHELGHWIWREEDIGAKLGVVLRKNMINSYTDEWPRFRKAFWDEEIDKLQTDPKIHDVFLISYDSAIKQLEELFADFVGLKLFGQSYLHSFEYLLAPSPGDSRWRDYPGMRTRAAYLETAAARFGIAIPTNYSSHFDDPSVTGDPAEVFLTTTSDAATGDSIPSLLDCVGELSERLRFPTMSPQKAAECLRCIRGGIPCQDAEYIGNIVNAGWAAYLDDAILPWPVGKEGRRIDALNEILLKSIEVNEYEARMKVSDAANG
jgi:hypothetical protein